MAALEAKRRRHIRQDTFPDLVGITRPTLANILAGRFGASPETAERIHRDHHDDARIRAPTFPARSGSVNGSVIHLAEARAERHAASIASAVLADLAVIQARLIGYFHADAGNPVTDTELGAAGLLSALAERLEMAAHALKNGQANENATGTRMQICAVVAPNLSDAAAPEATAPSNPSAAALLERVPPRSSVLRRKPAVGCALAALAIPFVCLHPARPAPFAMEAAVSELMKASVLPGVNRRWSEGTPYERRNLGSRMLVNFI